MGKDSILAELNSVRAQLNVCRAEHQELLEKYETLEELSEKCKQQISQFEQNMAQRANRLNRVQGLAQTVKSAARYYTQMQEMLNGREYSAAVRNIDEMQNRISQMKRTVSSDICNMEGRISALEARAASLQYQYDTYPEEVQPNGK